MSFKKLFSIFVALTFITAPLFSAQKDLFTPETWKRIEPYLMPESHPIKKTLDKLFKHKRLISDERAIKKAGFRIKARKSEKHTYVLSHYKLEGYLIKCLLDSQEHGSDEYLCIRRTEGATRLKQTIRKYGYDRYFKVPKKWIYVLPEKVYSPEYPRNRMILVAEKFDLQRVTENKKRWGSSKGVSTNLLKALYHVLTERGLVDSVYIDNIPFATDGKVAFVDTEHVDVWPVPYHRLTRYLSERRKTFWLNLIRE